MNRKYNWLRKPDKQERIGLGIGKEALTFGITILQEVITEAAQGQEFPPFTDTVKALPNGNVRIVPKQVTLTLPDGETVELVIYRWRNKARIETLAEFTAFMDACEGGNHIDLE
jgi:hypothetical protein